MSGNKNINRFEGTTATLVDSVYNETMDKI